MARDDCRDRWQSEAQRVRMYRRQYQHLTTYTAPGDPISIARQVVADAERLSEHIAITLALMDGICDEHNGHTAGTWEHEQRPVSA